jgi:hypothetical protein
VNTPNGFHSGAAVDSGYVDGVSLTHGRDPRKHIWTFAAGLCPGNPPPAFVGDDYFYDGHPHVTMVYLNNPLWDGVGCGTYCCRRNHPPWFHKQLPRVATDDVEMRVCRDSHRDNEDLGIKLMEIYIK